MYSRYKVPVEDVVGLNLGGVASSTGKVTSHRASKPCEQRRLAQTSGHFSVYITKAEGALQQQSTTAGGTVQQHHYNTTTEAIQQHYRSTTTALQQHCSSTTALRSTKTVPQQHYNSTTTALQHLAQRSTLDEKSRTRRGWQHLYCWALGSIAPTRQP